MTIKRSRLTENLGFCYGKALERSKSTESLDFCYEMTLERSNLPKGLTHLDINKEYPISGQSLRAPKCAQ